MNNYRHVYRVEHSRIIFNGIGIGPYTFFRMTLSDIVSQCSPDITIGDIKTCQEYITKYEPYDYQVKPLGLYKSGKTLPASYRWIRPGPREDPLLREYFKKNYLKDPENAASEMNESWTKEPFVFAFDSVEQFRRWFFCEKELEALAKLGFILKPYKVKSDTVVVGRSQCLCKLSGIYNRKNVFKVMATSLNKAHETIHTAARNTT